MFQRLTRRSRSDGRAERLGLDRIKLVLGDRAAVQKLLGRLDLACRPATIGSLADVIIELRLRRLSLLFAAVSHSVVVENQVRQNAYPRNDHDQDHPRSLPPPRNVAPPEDIREADDRDPDEEDPREDDQDVPEKVEKGIRRRSNQHGSCPRSLGLLRTLMCSARGAYVPAAAGA